MRLIFKRDSLPSSTRFGITLLIAVGLPAAHAGNGNRVGNGGNVVVCPESVRLLDFYEAGIVPDASASGDAWEAATGRSQSLAPVHPDLSHQLTARLKEMKAELEFKKAISLVEVPDSLHAFQPVDPRCSIRQIVIRKAQIPVGESRFLVDQSLWDKLDRTSQAGLLLHEVIYERFSKLGETDSRKARAYNARLFKGDFARMKPSEYWLYIQSLRLPLYPNG